MPTVHFDGSHICVSLWREENEKTYKLCPYFSNVTKTNSEFLIRYYKLDIIEDDGAYYIQVILDGERCGISLRKEEAEVLETRLDVGRRAKWPEAYE